MSEMAWYMIPNDVVRELETAKREREALGDAANAGTVQRAHLRHQKAMEALAKIVLGEK
jgi:rRNA-processing protein FCF1